MWANWLPIITLVATLTKDLPKTLEMDFTKHLCGYQYFAYTPSKSTPSNILKAKCFYLFPSDPTNTSFLGLVLVGRMFTSLITESMVTICERMLKSLSKMLHTIIQTSKIIPIHRRDLTALGTISSIDYYVISHAQI